MESISLSLQKLLQQFPVISAENAVVKGKKLYVEIPEGMLLTVLGYLKNELDFYHLSTITGLDNGEQFEFLYHVAHENGDIITVKIKTVRDGASVPTVLPIFEGATFYEREMHGLLGVKVEGLPEGRQYPLPDNWPEGEYPLRKDWKPKAQRDAEANQGGQANG